MFIPYRAYKTIEDDDLKFPLIYGEGKKVGVHLPQMENKAVSAEPGGLCVPLCSAWSYGPDCGERHLPCPPGLLS